MGRITDNKLLWGQYGATGFLLVALSYFVIHAFVGAGSIQALRGLEIQEAVLISEANAAVALRDSLAERITMLDDANLDPDFLEGSVRKSLGLIADDEVVLLTRR